MRSMMLPCLLGILLVLAASGSGSAAAPWWQGTVVSHQVAPQQEPVVSCQLQQLWSAADAQALAWVQQRRLPQADGFWSAVTFLGDPKLHLGYGLAAHWLGSQDDPNLLWSIALTGIVTGLSKTVLGQARPKLDEGPVFRGPSLDRNYAAMPSAHTAVSFAAAAYWAQRTPEAAPLFYGAAGLVGASRLILEEHWPSNVLLGAVLGMLVTQQWLQRTQP